MRETFAKKGNIGETFVAFDGFLRNHEKKENRPPGALRS